MTQKEALDILKLGHNVFLTGAAGSGKTHLLNAYIRHLKDHQVSVGITASTGIAATHLGGTTIHAWSGLGIKNQLSDYELDELETKRYLWDRLAEVKVLIIDEISMMHPFQLDLVDRILRSFRRTSAPFGGIQVIFCGDFFQLPPVSSAGVASERFAFHARSWGELNLKVCYLEEQHRQSDQTYLKILNAIRDQNVSDEVIACLQSRFDQALDKKLETTRLYTHNFNVDLENNDELAKMPGTTYEYLMIGSGKDHLVEILKRGCLAPEKLRLKKGSRVMFVKNNFEEGYVNGTIGVVHHCDSESVVVRTSRGALISVKPAIWVIEDDGKIKAEIHQYPLRLAWAITVHKSQGMSLDAAEVDLSRSFEPGMGYVALSRVRSLDGLSLKGLNHEALKISPEVATQDEKFRKLSRVHAEELKSLSSGEKKKVQDEFLQAIAGDKKAKKGRGSAGKVKKLSTLDETKTLIKEGGSLSEIAKERGLTIGTILDHAEKIKKTDRTCDFTSLCRGLTQAKIKKIKAALLRVGMHAGTYPLNPAKELLGPSYSYEEIRLVRLFLN